jgi:hypothetical protein
VLEGVANKVCQALLAPSGEPAEVDKNKNSIFVVSIAMLPVINVLLRYRFFLHYICAIKHQQFLTFAVFAFVNV